MQEYWAEILGRRHGVIEGTGLHATDRDAIVQWATQHPEVLEIYLYGSRARGDHRPDSDIDLAIVMPWQKWGLWHDAFQRNPDLRLSAKVHFELYEKNGEQERVAPGVNSDGILLYRHSLSATF